NSNALGTASTGPTPIISGSTPATAYEWNLTSGVRPSASAFSRSMTRTDAAPSLICDEFPAVTDPFGLKAGGKVAKTSSDVSGLTPSSVSNINVFSSTL